MILEAMAAVTVIILVIGPAVAGGVVLGEAIEGALKPGTPKVRVKVDNTEVEVDLSEFISEEGDITIHYRIARGRDGEVVVLSKAEAEYIQFANGVKAALESGRPLKPAQLKKMLHQLVSSALEREQEIKKTTKRRGRRVES